MMKPEYLSFLQNAIAMARAAGDIQLEFFRTTHLDTHIKQNDSDVVTAADKACEKLIKDMIHEKYPAHGIIAEESGSENADREWRWVIDPLDGTTNFSQGLPVFSVSIALEHNGKAVVGVVYAPYIGELFHAVRAGGAFLNGKRIYCSHKLRLSEAVVATGVPYDKLTNPDNNIKEITSVIPQVRGVRRLGSAAVDLCYVGAGFFDAYWELNINRWDVAAGMLVASEAGAKVSSIRENRNYSILACVPGIEAQMRCLLGSDCAGSHL